MSAVAHSPQLVSEWADLDWVDEIWLGSLMGPGWVLDGLSMDRCGIETLSHGSAWHDQLPLVGLDGALASPLLAPQLQDLSSLLQGGLISAVFLAALIEDQVHLLPAPSAQAPDPLQLWCGEAVIWQGQRLALSSPRLDGGSAEAHAHLSREPISQPYGRTASDRSYCYYPQRLRPHHPSFRGMYQVFLDQMLKYFTDSQSYQSSQPLSNEIP